MESVDIFMGTEEEKKLGIPKKETFKEGIPRKPFEIDYFREAKLFLSKNRATLTFFLGSEVASIHFDKKRNEIFFKGHNVKNMTLAQEQWLALKKFPEYLVREKADPEIITAYQECFAHIPPPR